MFFLRPRALFCMVLPLEWDFFDPSSPQSTNRHRAIRRSAKLAWPCTREMSYSKSSKRESSELFKIQHQNDELFKIQQQRWRRDARKLASRKGEENEHHFGERRSKARERERETLSESESVLVDSVIEKRETSGERRVKSFFLFFFFF